MVGPQRRRRRIRREQLPDNEAVRAPSPHDLAGLGATFALTAAVHDPEPVTDVDPLPEPNPADHPDHPDQPYRPDDPHTERGLRGLVGGGTSQVSVGSALRARDAARPSEADLARAEAELVIVRRGWVPREDLPRGPRR